MAAFGGARGAPSRPPEKGIFPLDHFGECKQVCLCFCVCAE
jgi:cytochrome c oxidase assembly protein subunit 19